MFIYLKKADALINGLEIKSIFRDYTSVRISGYRIECGSREAACELVARIASELSEGKQLITIEEDCH